jgi:hypothetical protein
LVEVGTALNLQLRLGDPNWRIRLGGRIGAAQLWLPAAREVEDGAADWGWTARAAATVGVGARVQRTSWLELGLSPGALLHAVEGTGPAGESWTVGGFALDASLGLSTDFGLELGRPDPTGAGDGGGVDRRP